jgi:hypothetical protein
MPCSVNNNLSPMIIPVYPVPGLPTIPLAPIQIPIPGFEFPEGFPEKILELIEQLSSLFPGGTFAPQLDDITQTILSAIASIFTQIAPFLAFYNFIMALLNMVLCIIEVLCAMPNAYKTYKAIKKLFKVCLPAFLALFPWLALLLMILAILLLILALIEYIINRLLQIIEDLLRNIRALGDVVNTQDPEAIEAIAIKIASLLCLIENLFAIFSALAMILAIINSLAAMGGHGVCNDNGILNVNCCDDETCPPFVANNPDGYIYGIQGRLIYYNRIERNPLLNLNFTRNESWQFVNDDGAAEYPFDSVITSYGDGDDFWPDGKTYDGASSLKKVPYALKLILRDFNPAIFHPTDIGGARDFTINNVVVSTRPYDGVLNEQNVLDPWNTNGTFSLRGGTVYDGDTIYTTASNIETFIHNDPDYGGNFPTTDDGYYINDVEFEWFTNQPALLDNRLITFGCIPEVKMEREMLNARFSDTRSVLEQVPKLADGGIIPDYSKLSKCASDNMAELRKDVSVATIEAFRTNVLACLEDYKSQTEDAYKNIFITAVDPFNSTFTIEPSLQFITQAIKVSVTLKDKNNNVVGIGIPSGLQAELAALIAGIPTFGEIGTFTYESSTGNFVGNLTSQTAGTGDLSVSFNGNIFQKVENLNSDTATTIVTNTLPYEFIGSDREEKVRRTVADISIGGE